MCLNPGNRMQRRRPCPLPVLCCQDSASDSDNEFRLPARNSHPEIFTFDVEFVTEPPARGAQRRGASRRSRRVLYPAKVRRYLPPPETDRPLRWLYLLCLLVLVQICCEDVVPEELAPSTGAPLTARTPHGLLPPTAEPALPFSNHSHQHPLQDITLSWLYHQR